MKNKLQLEVIISVKISMYVGSIWPTPCVCVDWKRLQRSFSNGYIAQSPFHICIEAADQ